MDKEKEEFLKEFGDSYGYPNGPKSIDAIRATEFKRLDGLVYLDHAGATLYSELQMDSIFKELTSSVYGNPPQGWFEFKSGSLLSKTITVGVDNSVDLTTAVCFPDYAHTQSDTSIATSEIVREVRQQVLDFCNASPKDYTCIFTSGATSALKLVGEAFPWSSRSCFLYTMENHNSVLGIREYALDQGGAACAVDIEESVQGEESSINVSLHSMQRRSQHMDMKVTGDTTHSLFALPSECNFSGVRFNLELVKMIQQNSERVLPHFHKSKWMVLIDAAKGCATEKLDLSKYPADFVTISFYKLFGYPTGLGALIVRNDSASVLRKRYFSGGTVAATIADIDFVKRRESIHELFEDGTASFLGIASLLHGFKVLNTLSIPAISRHTRCLATYLRKVLLDLKHDNGTYVCTVYGNQVLKDIGPVISFNLKRPDGSWFGYREVEKLASLSGIQLRTGCFCNPGACAKYLGLTHHDLLSNVEAGHVCWDDNDILHGKPTGAVRISFGYMSTFEDAKKFIDFVKKSFVHNHFTSSGSGSLQSVQGFHVKSIYVYPIKSCAGFSVRSWPLSSTGFLHDRAWVLKSVTGEILNQKKVPEMGLISTSIDLDRGVLIVKTSKCKEKLEISVEPDPQHRSREEINLHARRYEVQVYDDNEVSTWFTNAIGRPCNLLRCSSTNDYACVKKSGSVDSCRDTTSRLNFTNEAQFLLMSEQSLFDLNTRINSGTGSQEVHAQISPTRFRPNIVVSGGYPYAEDDWITLRIGKFSFSSMGGCSRCQMINLSSEGGRVQKSKEPLATLASYRRVKGKILFGVLLRHEDTDPMIGSDDDRRIKVGDEVLPDVN